MIVLGIAALILAGVLIAVPALQRNQRNNNRRADISYVQAQLTAYQGSNQNALPTTGEQISRGVLSEDDESAYYAANNDWNTVPAAGAQGWHLEAGGAATHDGDDAEYNIWVDDNDATNPVINTDRDVGRATTVATGGDPLPDEEHFDIFIGYSCRQATITPAAVGGEFYYPNSGTVAAPAVADAGTVANLFVNEDGRARDFAIVYRLEGENAWRCQDNT